MRSPRAGRCGAFWLPHDTSGLRAVLIDAAPCGPPRGADAQTTINREEFGMPMGKDYGIKMEVALRIQVEAVAAK